MRIAHTHRRALPLFAAGRYGNVIPHLSAHRFRRRVPGRQTAFVQRYLLCRKHRAPHIHFRARTHSAAQHERQRLYAARGLHGQFLFLCITAVVSILPHTADGVAAHFSLAAVEVEHSHPHVRDGARHDEHHAVAAHAEVAVADARYRADQLFFTRKRVLFRQVEVDIIVARSVHFHKFHINSFIYRLHRSWKVRARRDR